MEARYIKLLLLSFFFFQPFLVHKYIYAYCITIYNAHIINTPVCISRFIYIVRSRVTVCGEKIRFGFCITFFFLLFFFFLSARSSERLYYYIRIRRILMAPTNRKKPKMYHLRFCSDRSNQNLIEQLYTV